MTNHEDIANDAIEAVNRQIESDSMSAAEALYVAKIVDERSRILILWRAAIMRASGSTKVQISKLLGYANSGNVSRIFPELDALAATIRRAEVRAESVKVDVRGTMFVYQGSGKNW